MNNQQTIENLEKSITEAQKLLAELKAKPDGGEWAPDGGEFYYFLNAIGVAKNIRLLSNDIFDDISKRGPIARTAEELKDADEIRMFRMRWKRAADRGPGEHRYVPVFDGENVIIVAMNNADGLPGFSTEEKGCAFVESDGEENVRKWLTMGVL